jgi:transposase-like protein
VPQCTFYEKRQSIRNGSLFETLGKDLRKILKIMLRWCAGQDQNSFVSSIQISTPTYRKLFILISEKMKISNESSRKLGGSGAIVQIDETMLNYKCKSHRGRSPENETDCLCIVECTPQINRVLAQVIPEKRMSTLFPIICDRVVMGSVIHTDEHRSYSSLNRNGYYHNTVCHKYNFVNP